MIKRILSGVSAFVISLSSLFVLAPAIASAAVDTCTWDGSSNNNWNTAANWSCTSDGEAVPGAGDSLVFPTAGSGDKTLTNDITAGTSFASITFSGTGTVYYIIEGNAIALTSGMTNSSSTNQVVNLNVALSSSVTFNTTRGLSLGGVISGSSDIAKTGTSYLDFGGDNTFLGNVAVNAGRVSVSHVNGLGSPAGGTTVAADAGIEFRLEDGGQTIGEPLTINSAAVISQYGSDSSLYASAACNHAGCSGDITFSGAIVLGANVLVSTFGSKVTLTGSLSGAHTISLANGDPGQLVINSSDNGSQTPNGTTEAPAKTTTYDQDAPNDFITVGKNEIAILTGKYGGATVLKGGLLKGTGTLKGGELVVQQGGAVAPGMSPGCLAADELTLSGEYQFEAKGKTVCTEYDQLKITGVVNLQLSNNTPSTSTLKVDFLDKYNPAAGTTFTILDNDGTDAVVGTFKDLAEGATFKAPNGAVLKISYKGGDGNDVVLTVVTAGTPDTGFSLLLNNPALTLGLTAAAAGTILVMSRRMKPATKRARR